jgi:hypothetical protein
VLGILLARVNRSFVRMEAAPTGALAQSSDA